MTSIPNFPSLAGPAVTAPSNDLVHFRVKVDRSRCDTNDPAIDLRLTELEHDGLTLSIAQLVAGANLHFAGSVQDEGHGLEDARMKAAWNLLRGWNMTSTSHHTRPSRTVLVVAEQPNSRMTAMRSEVRAVSIALVIGIRLYNVAYAYWAATEGLQAFDLSATDEAGNEFRIEARGRINRTNVQTAVQQVYTKFAQPNFSQAAGVIFFPRTNNRGREDIVVLDPEGEPERLMANSRYRNLLKHYVPIFIAQGGPVRAFGERLKALSESPDEVFSSYLEGGDAALSSRTVRRGRSGFAWNGTLYVGAFFEDIAWPVWLTGIERPPDGGAFFWGISKEVITTFQGGQLASLKFAADEQPIISRTERVMSIVMPDRTLLIWAESMPELLAAEDSHVSKSRDEHPPTD
jgi:hypothetical protein